MIDAATFDPTEPLEVEMLPGDGALSGVVRGPKGGPLGGATVTISDGTTTITTSSASRGRVGRWEVSGLATPASYLVEASSFGLGTESQLVDLGPAESGTVNLRLQPGIAVLRGKIQGKISGGRTDGLGGVTVSVSDNDGNARSATTVTTGKFAGTFQLPGLPLTRRLHGVAERAGLPDRDPQPDPARRPGRQAARRVPGVGLRRGERHRA